MSFPSFDLLKRFLDRCSEASSDTAIHPEVKSMFEDVLSAPATTYLSAFAGVPVAETQADDAHVALSKVMAKSEKEFRRVRAIIAGRFPSTVVPSTLKNQSTPTEQKSAIEALLGLVTARRGEPWADVILAGAFGTLVPDTLVKLAAVIEADTKLAAAREARSMAAEPAYRAYLQFKEVLRNEPGPEGRWYKRLRTPTIAAVTEPTVTTHDPPVVTTAPVLAEAPTNGVSH